MQKHISHSAKFLQRRKFLLVLPLIVFPFLTMLFWALGGGKGVHAAGNHKKTIQGFNMDLPAAKNPSDSTWNKLNYYEQADKDSARLRQLMKSDPYYTLPLAVTEGPDHTPTELLDNERRRPSMDSSEALMHRKLAELDRQLNEAAPTHMDDEPARRQKIVRRTSPASPASEVDRLERMMQAMQDGNGETDPQLAQLSGMLEKIMDIQHPERVQQKIQEQSQQQRGKILSVQGVKEDPITVLDAAMPPPSLNGVYSLEASNTIPGNESNVIRGIIPSTQTLVNGATVKIELSHEVFINGILIPAHHFVYGTAQLSNERLMVSINSVRYQDHLLPVALAVHDLDGMAGLYVPGAITRDVAKQSADQSLQSLGMLSLDPSLGAQAASAGIQTAKNLLSKKVRQIKVKVKAGYQVLLKDMNERK